MCLWRSVPASASGARWDCGQGGAGLVIGGRSTICSRTATIRPRSQRLCTDRHASREGRIRVPARGAVVVVVNGALVDRVGAIGRHAGATSEWEGRGLSRRGSGEAEGGNRHASSLLVLRGSSGDRARERTCRTTGAVGSAEDGVEGLGREGTTTVLGASGRGVLVVGGHGEGEGGFDG
jgi:hypothetical protein